MASPPVVLASNAESGNIHGSKADRLSMNSHPQAVNHCTTAVVLDAHGVIFRNADDVADLLVPFVKARNKFAAEAEVNAMYLRRSLGLMAAGVFWTTLGVPGDPERLDAAYTSLHRLSPGIKQFLRRLTRDGTQVLCCSNDVAEWSLQLRRIHKLEPAIPTWVISGETGSRKPGSAIYVELVKHLSCAS